MAKELIIRILKEQAYPLPHGPEILFIPHGLAKDFDLPGHGPQEPHDQMKKRGLPTAIGSNETDPLLLPEFKKEIF
jgi:hypothetical protein